MTETELNRLETWLESPVFKGKAMRLDKLQGFLCAVISGPEMIAPSQWMLEALGAQPECESLAQEKEFIALMLGFYNDVASALQNNQPPKLILKPCASNDTRLDYQTWCEGYILGWGLSTQEWLQPGNEPLKRLTFPILYLSGAFREEAERQGKKYEPGKEDQKIWQDCVDALPQVITAICNFWLAKRKQAPVQRGQPKIGRNELCPCGSGKKFKQCCGNGHTVH
ncbi:MAG: UPF0149 family protein [Betaproteobacteria bacterium]|nr:UPF0149 family protein [Betaproteobacteria bacterium]